MSAIEPSSLTTLAILLGASEWPDADLSGSPAFARSASKVRDYLLGSFGLPRENFLDLFDQQISLSEVDVNISAFLETRIKSMKAAGLPPRDLLFYYIGHGMFAEGQDQAYHLALRSTRKGNIRTSAIWIVALSDTLKAKARHLRRLIILDCCFSGVAAKYMQSDAPGQAAIQQTIRAFKEHRQGSGFPQRGTALLCSSSRDLVSYRLRDESGTMFSEALVRVLTTGNKHQSATHLSLSDLRDSIEEMLERLAEEKSLAEEKPPRPEIHSPDQSEGDVARVPLFPNVAAQKELLRADAEESISILRDELYRRVLNETWEDKTLEAKEIELLTHYANTLQLKPEAAAALEREVMGETKETIWKRQIARERQKQYRQEVEAVWENRKLDKEKITRLKDLAEQLNLSQEVVTATEREVMGETKEIIFLVHQAPPLLQYSPLPRTLEGDTSSPAQPAKQTRQAEEKQTRKTLQEHRAAELEEFLRLGTDSSISFIEQTKQKSSQPSQTPQETQTKKILFHEVFKQERIRRGWTVEEMAEKIGVSPTTIAKWERGLTTPRDSIIIQSVLGKTPTELGLPERQTGSSSVSRRSQAVQEASSELIAKPKRQVLSHVPSLEQAKPKSSQPPPMSRKTQATKILFHEVLKQERIRHGWRVGEMAEIIGVNANTLAKWEQGRKIPQDPTSIQSLCSLLGRTSAELGLPEPRTSSPSVSHRPLAVQEASSERVVIVRRVESSARTLKCSLGHENPAGSFFCGECGETLSGPAPTLPAAGAATLVIEQAKPKSSQPPPMSRKTQATKILFHEVLKQERIRHGWRVGEMAEIIGVNANTLAKWEQGRKIPQDPTSIQSLCSLLGKTSAELGLESQY